MSLKGEKGQQPSRHADEATIHLGTPQNKTTTMHLIWILYDKESGREGQQMAMSHRLKALQPPLPIPVVVF
ncbi:hypothetical protein PAXINDRAFT_19970 [Paxillus involutus ATCC 200175]|uniref:Uncharacterized protein n=1 Tax=Paxillus involutus ATCC 200175 TaxID=664439 RepID=A0A0C9TFB8_PAXIN|nr:hypothetical protein PAXINDRAFT_19970 [Paxillus involutus ATCC 200175]